MTLHVTLEKRDWLMVEPFTISRGTQTHAECLIVTLSDEAGLTGRGESCGVTYAGETPDSMIQQIDAAQRALENGIDRHSLLSILPPGGARCAIDSALWDLEAKQTGLRAFDIAGVHSRGPVDTCYTIGIRPVADYERVAAAHSKYRYLKLKVDTQDPIGAVAAARRGAPSSAFIVDPNQAWSVEELIAYGPKLADFGVVLLEQPIKVGDEAALDAVHLPIALCADELINDVPDLKRAIGRFDVINIKLEKAGGLTAALELAQAARQAGLDLMVGCMGGSSLAMAPGTILAQHCAYVDLDGPLLQVEDWPNGLKYDHGVVSPPEPSFWG